MKGFVAVYLLAIVFLLSACSTQPVVTAQTRQGVDMRVFKTYAFKPGTGDDTSGVVNISSANVMAAVRTEMSTRGYQYVDFNPDLLVNFDLGVFNRPKTNYAPRVSLGAFGTYGGVGVDVPVGNGSNEDKVTRLGLELVDARRREVVWEGAYEGVLSNSDLANASVAIQNAVHGIFTYFPIK